MSHRYQKELLGAGGVMVWKYVLIRNDSSQVTEGRHASCRLGHLTLGPRTIQYTKKENTP